MNRNKKLILAVCILAVLPFAYWVISSCLIRICVSEIAFAGHSSVSLLPFSRTRFLIAMGKRSHLYIEKALNDSGTPPEKKVHLAWILSSMNDHSHFDIFLDALRSKRSSARYIAAVRMGDFPEECQLHLFDMLQGAVERKQHSYYWGVLELLASKASLSKDNENQLVEILMKAQFRGGTLSEAQRDQILSLFARREG